MTLSNSEQELRRLVNNYLEANAIKNKYNTLEAKSKKEIKAFLGEDNATLSVEFSNDNYEIQIGDQETETFILDPQALYKYAVATEQEGRFWDCVNVVKERAASVFSESQLAKVTKQVKNKTWNIKKKK